MNAVEIEEAISKLAEQPFDAEQFPYAFLEAFGRKATEIKRLKTGASNKSDIDGVLQRNNIHIKVCPVGNVSKTLDELRGSPATTKSKARFVLATDGIELRARSPASCRGYRRGCRMMRQLSPGSKFASASGGRKLFAKVISDVICVSNDVKRKRRT